MCIHQAFSQCSPITETPYLPQQSIFSSKLQRPKKKKKNPAKNLQKKEFAHVKPLESALENCPAAFSNLLCGQCLLSGLQSERGRSWENEMRREVAGGDARSGNHQVNKSKMHHFHHCILKLSASCVFCFNFPLASYL